MLDRHFEDVINQFYTDAQDAHALATFKIAHGDTDVELPTIADEAARVMKTMRPLHYWTRGIGCALDVVDDDYAVGVWASFLEARLRCLADWEAASLTIDDLMQFWDECDETDE